MTISPEKHMELLNRAWHKGIDKEATQEFVHKHMWEMLQVARAKKSEEYVKGYLKAMILATILLECTATYEECAGGMEKEVPDA